MSHPLKDYARGVQDELARDKTLEKATYQWCLRQTEDLYEHAKALAALDGGPSVVGHREFKAAVIVKLVEQIKPRAKKAEACPRCGRPSTGTPDRRGEHACAGGHTWKAGKR
jgi:hypothetical protein